MKPAARRRKKRERLDIIVPVYNEGKALPRFHTDLLRALRKVDCRWRILYIDDGSSDGTADLLLHLSARNRQTAWIRLSRNFGHQAALTAGLEFSNADIVVTMDGDGQHPPEMIQEMVGLVRKGYEVVQARRLDGGTAGRLKRWTSNAFYRVLNAVSGTRVTASAADYRAMSRRAVDSLRAMPEYHRFLRGMVAWMGFPTLILPYSGVDRIGGASKYSLGKMLRLASDAIFSFSLAPLYIGLAVGGAFFCLALLEMAYVLSFWVTGQTVTLAPGWSSLMFILLIVGGTATVLLGFIGVYVGYIFQEVKRRPVYIVGGASPSIRLARADRE